LYCPQCLTEYREGFKECADCRVLLQIGVPTLSRRDLHAPAELVGVFDTDDNYALWMAQSALRDADIPFVIVAIPFVTEDPVTERPEWWIRPSRVLVPVANEAEALGLLGPLREPEFISEIDADTPQAPP
jgi:hypothetical protein